MKPDPLERRPDALHLRMHRALIAAGVGKHAQDINDCREPTCIEGGRAVVAWWNKRQAPATGPQEATA